MAEQEQDRSEAATPYKLNEARKRGQLAKSADIIGAVVFATAVVYLNARGWEGVRAQFQFDRLLLAQAPRVDPSGAALWGLTEHLLRETFALLAPLLAGIVLAAIVGNLLQTGPVFTLKPLVPQWDRLNPVTGFKKLFSLRTLFDGARACVKLLLLVLVVYHALKAILPQFHQLARLTPLAFLRTLLDDVASVAMKIAGALLLIALVDWTYTAREFAKKMRMSRRELKDEVKHREGDPRIRARLRELRREMLKRALAARKTRDADVVITNPTHLAVALCYRHGEMEAPRLVAKGAGALAAAMRKIAARHRIPVVQNPSLARALYQHMEVDQSVPPQLYGPVARLMVWVLAMRRIHARGAVA